jgi:ATP-dependent DNA ligase
MRRRRNPFSASGPAHSIERGPPLATLPAWISPQLTRLVHAAPDGDQWLHEIKYDGYRMHARLDHRAVKLLTRTGLEWTGKYPQIAKAVAALDAHQAYLDGELCGVGPDGITSFSMIQLASISEHDCAPARGVPHDRRRSPALIRARPYGAEK